MKEALLQILYAAIGSVGFALIFDQKFFSRVLPAALGGTLAWAVYLGAAFFGCDLFFAALISGVFVGLWSELFARLLKAPATVFQAIGILPLVPGSSLYYTMENALRRDWVACRRYGIHTLLYALGIAAGLALVSALSYTLSKMLCARKRKHSS